LLTEHDTYIFTEKYVKLFNKHVITHKLVTCHVCSRLWELLDSS